MDGRDIGTVVFPDADIKLFLLANNQVRAQRRYDELRQKGIHVSFQEVSDNINDRDFQDSNREISPLVQAEDAVTIDNSTMDVEGQMKWFMNLLKSKYGGMQDNGSWSAPSYSPGGIEQRDWIPVGFGDGFNIGIPFTALSIEDGQRIAGAKPQDPCHMMGSVWR